MNCLLSLLEVDPISTHLRAIRSSNYIGTRSHMLFKNHSRFSLTLLLYSHCFALMQFRYGPGTTVIEVFLTSLTGQQLLADLALVKEGT